MDARSTLFFDIGAQRDCWPGGAWPLVGAEEAANVARLFALAARLGIRQAGSICAHDDAGIAGAAAGGVARLGAGARGERDAADVAIDRASLDDPPAHCRVGSAGAARAPGCDPARPPRYWAMAAGECGRPALDREHSEYLAVGCRDAPDAPPLFLRIFDHVAAGIRDAVVLGAGIEHGIDRAVDALVRRRIRTHVALDASGSRTPEGAQQVIAAWKRRTVDVTTTAMIERLLTRGD